MAVFRAGLTLFLLAQATGPLAAAEISFFCMDALAPSMRELVPEFEKASGHHVRTTIANAGTIAARLQSGEPADLGTSSSPRPFRSAAGNGQLQTSCCASWPRSLRRPRCDRKASILI